MSQFSVTDLAAAGSMLSGNQQPEAKSVAIDDCLTSAPMIWVSVEKLGATGPRGNASELFLFSGGTPLDWKPDCHMPAAHAPRSSPRDCFIHQSFAVHHVSRKISALWDGLQGIFSRHFTQMDPQGQQCRPE